MVHLDHIALTMQDRYEAPYRLRAKTNLGFYDGTFLAILTAAVFTFLASTAVAQLASAPSTQSIASVTSKFVTPDLTGVYGLDSAASLPKTFKNVGGPDDVPLQASAVAKEKEKNLKDDPAKNCQPIGPFRMMARDGNKIEFLVSPGRITMLFESIALGHMRTFYLNRLHPANLDPSWEGDSIGHWEGDTLVVDTIGFDNHTWLNAAGAPHSDDFHLVERYRLVQHAEYLEVKVRAEDPATLTKPYSYTRYYQRMKTEVQEDFCKPDE